MIDYPTITADQIRPGAFRIDSREYHKGAGVSSSELKTVLKKSPAHTKVRHEDTGALAFGRAFHSYILEHEKFDDEYVVGKMSAKRGKAYDALVEAHPECDVVLEKDLDQIRAMRDALERTETWQKYKTWDTEIAFFVDDNGLLLKCKTDMIGDRIVDLKSTACAASEDFLRDAYKFGYHISAAYYIDIIKVHTGVELPFIWVAVEKTEPFGVSFIRCPDSLLAVGREKYQDALHTWRNCLQIDKWPGYPDREIEPDVPRWMLAG